MVRRREQRRRRRRLRGARRGARARRRWSPSASGGSGPWRRWPSACGDRPRSRCGSARPSWRGWRAPGGRPRRSRSRSASPATRSLRFVSIARPASAASSRAAAIWSLVSGSLDSTSQPLATCFQPWRRSPSSVTNEDGRRPLRLAAGAEDLRLSILWTFVMAERVADSEAQDRRAWRSGRSGRPGSRRSDRPWRGRPRGTRAGQAWRRRAPDRRGRNVLSAPPASRDRPRPGARCPRR